MASRRPARYLPPASSRSTASAAPREPEVAAGRGSGRNRRCGRSRTRGAAVAPVGASSQRFEVRGRDGHRRLLPGGLDSRLPSRTPRARGAPVASPAGAPDRVDGVECLAHRLADPAESGLDGVRRGAPESPRQTPRPQEVGAVIPASAAPYSLSGSPGSRRSFPDDRETAVSISAIPDTDASAPPLPPRQSP
jgi:hypothetical protein